MYKCLETCFFLLLLLLLLLLSFKIFFLIFIYYLMYFYLSMIAISVYFFRFSVINSKIMEGALKYLRFKYYKIINNLGFR